MLAPRELVHQVLKGDDDADRVVLTAASGHVPASDVERRLRNLGMCLVVEGPPLFHAETPGIKEERVLVQGEGDAVVEQRRVHTPEGTLTTVVRHGADGHDVRTVKRLFKTADDYAPLVSYFAAQRYAPNADEFHACQERLGVDVLLRPHLGYTPMHAIMHELMGLEVFAEEWARRRQQIVELYKALVDNRRRLFDVVAASPATAVTYGGDLNARELGEERFNRYVLPAFHEFADAMHGAGKLAGLHVHGDPGPLVKGLGRTRADYIEGLHPTRDFGIDHMRRAWPKMALWLEMPPDVHHGSLEDRSHWVGAVLKRGRGQRVLLEVAAVLPAPSYRKSLLAVTAAVEHSMKGKPLAAGTAGATPAAEEEAPEEAEEA